MSVCSIQAYFPEYVSAIMAYSFIEFDHQSKRRSQRLGDLVYKYINSTGEEQKNLGIRIEFMFLTTGAAYNSDGVT